MMKKRNLILSFSFLFALSMALFSCGHSHGEGADHDHGTQTETKAHDHDGHDHSGHDHDGHDHGTSTKAHGANAAYTSAFVCPMHCKDSGAATAGKCPVCKMDYVAQAEHTKDGHSH